VPEYRTEFVVPPDRYICIQLPPDLPEGRATITVTVHAPAPVDPAAPSDRGDEPSRDLDHQDIEWWEEFEDDASRH
jgi:hypothetical protein